MQRKHVIAFGGLLLFATATVVGVPAIFEDRARKLEVYRAYLADLPAGFTANLANTTTRFSASFEDVAACAPSVMATTAISRHFRTISLTSNDFTGLPVRVVDPLSYADVVDAHDPLQNTGRKGVQKATEDAFNAGMFQFSDVGFDLTGQYAVLDFSFRCGVLCGHGGTILFKRVGKKWVYFEKRPLPRDQYDKASGMPGSMCGSGWSS